MERKKQTFTIFFLTVIISSAIFFQDMTKTESVDPLFTLVAKCTSPTQADILFMLKQQLAPIGINLDVILQTFPYFFDPDPDFTAIRDHDLAIIEFNNYTNMGHQKSMWVDPFFTRLYSENGSIITLGYESSLDWNEELGTGRNEWYIQNGQEMISNGSQMQKEFCWEWQNYLMDEILPCIPLFIHKNDSSSLQLLVFNLREVRPVIGSRSPTLFYTKKPKGLAIKKAISYALNRKEIKRIVLGDDYEITHHPINPTNKSWLNPDIFRYCHNLQVARNYMTVIGYDLGWPHNWGGYETWPDWEDVCSPSATTIEVNGFGMEIAVFCLSICTIPIFYYTRRRRKELKV